MNESDITSNREPLEPRPVDQVERSAAASTGCPAANALGGPLPFPRTEWQVLLATALLTVGVSALGAFVCGYPFDSLLRLPPAPRTRPVPSFSPWLFTLSGVALAFVLRPYLMAIVRVRRPLFALPDINARLPWYGVLGGALTVLSWVIAWTRMPAAAAIQHHTYIGLWLGYILTIEGLLAAAGQKATWQLFPRRYLLLYPTSAIFWWSYEWLNRVVENWSYLHVSGFTPAGYALLASLSFSTVLPAVVATGRLAYTVLPLRAALFRHVPLRLHPRAVRRLLLVSLFVLLALPAAPDELYPFLWPAPMVLVLLLDRFRLERGYLCDLERGRWDRIVAAALGALICGFFWELWNLHSLAKWIYHVPYVGGAYLFEMPLLGFGGYLPFGVLCAAVSRLVLREDPIAPDRDEEHSEDPVPAEAHAHTPAHIAIIMDGNGRWARARGLPRSAGHRAGVERLREIVRECRRSGVRYLTVFAFSEENWKRPSAEVELLMRLLEEQLAAAAMELKEHDIRFRVMGNIERLSAPLQRALRALEQETAECRALQLVVALSYGARQELIRVVRELHAEGARSVDEQSIRSHLYLPDLPDPDLIIRTSGELRLSNFLLWQAAYAELAFVETYWPDFGAEELRRLIGEFGARDRRYGALDVKGGR